MPPPTPAQLRTARAIIRQEREDIEQSDDLCYTNGRLTTHLEAEARLTAQIRELEQKENVNLDKETYLADGVYARHDGLQLWLRAERDGRMHEIAIDDECYAALTRYVKDAPWRNTEGTTSC